MRIAVLGLGEAGSRYAADLRDAGHHVTGFDPGPVGTPEGVSRAATAAEAVSDVELVIALTPSRFSAQLVRDASSFALAGIVWADLSSASPEVMVDAGETAATAGLRFADGAVLGTVPAKGARTPLVLSGPGADGAAAFFRQLGADVEQVDGPPGRATAMKLVRSVALKGFAVVTVEAIEAARAAGIETWMRGQIADQLAGGEVLVDRFLSGTVAHAARRAHEMRDATAYLAGLGVPAVMAEASATALERIDRATGGQPAD